MSRYAAKSLLMFTVALSLLAARAGAAPQALFDGQAADADVPASATQAPVVEPQNIQDESTADAAGEAAEAEADDSGLQRLPASTGKPITEAGTELIRERFPSSAVKVERQVAQDADGNYFNHGPWTQWDERGNVVAQGEFRNGRRNGKWFRWYGNEEAPLFSGPGFKGFTAPFGTEATFDDGQINGVWKVFDAKHRVICEWTFDRDIRHGRSTWFFPNGHKQMELNYLKGQIDGEVVQWNSESKVVLRDRYIDGRKLEKSVTWHAPKKKKAEGWFLHARENAGATYDWWNGTVKMIPADKDLNDQRHGGWVWWYSSGLKQLEGTYDYDKPVGTFTWWHSNGQKQLEGEFKAGKQNGKFTWWYANGQKQLEQEYADNVAQGPWKRWAEDGKVVEAGNYAEGTAPLEPAPAVGAEGPIFESPTADARGKTEPRAQSNYKR